MNSDFYVNRAAKNIPNISFFEEEALKQSPDFRKKVIQAFKDFNAPGAELIIEINQGTMHLSWFRPTARILNLAYKLYDPAQTLLQKINKNIVQEPEKKDLDQAVSDTGEWTKLISGIIKKTGCSTEFTKRTFGDKYILFGCRLNFEEEKKPFILISSRNSRKNTIDIGLVVSVYSVDNTLYNIPNIILISNYRVVPDSESLKPDHIPIGFNSPKDLGQIIKWFEQ